MKKTVFAGIALAAAAASADVTLSGIFTDDMVLQHGRPLPVWGRAEPGESVTVAFLGNEAKAQADAAGDWEVRLPALPVVKEGAELKVTGKNTVVLKNVLVGDVWLVSGQSNSEMSFGWGIINGDAEKARAKDFPNIRSIKFNHWTSAWPVRFRTAAQGPWRVDDNGDVLNGVTAMGYFFAREINERTGIPIGILDDNWSGCCIEPFICAEGIAKVPEFAHINAELDKSRAEILKWSDAIQAAKATGSYGEVGNPPGNPFWTGQHNAMIEPIVRFPITGALWYQGCSNGGEGRTYAMKLEALVAGWRAKWGSDFPFYIVQLSSFTEKTTDPAGGNGFARIRNAQRIASQTIPGTGLAVTVDIGNDRDIHPKNKYDVGYRLSLWARRDVYGEKNLVVSGPLYTGMNIEGSSIRLSFDHVGGGLMAGEKGPDTPGVMPTPTPDGKLRGFALQGADGQWRWADAVIDGKTVVVSCADVAEPKNVRYAHRANPMGNCNLYNAEGLPASPFTTEPLD